MKTNSELLEEYYDFFKELQKKWKVTDDCMQMIYMDFLEYDNAKLNKIYETSGLRFWIVRVIKNYWYSGCSRYYSLYRKYYTIIKSTDDVEPDKQ